MTGLRDGMGATEAWALAVAVADNDDDDDDDDDDDADADDWRSPLLARRAPTPLLAALADHALEEHRAGGHQVEGPAGGEVEILAARERASLVHWARASRAAAGVGLAGEA